jgi:hypothetical protein
MNERQEVKNLLIVRARRSNRLRTKEDFSLHCEEVASEVRWVGDYVDSIRSFGRLVSEAWREANDPW